MFMNFLCLGKRKRVVVVWLRLLRVIMADDIAMARFRVEHFLLAKKVYIWLVPLMSFILLVSWVKEGDPKRLKNVKKD